MPELQKILAKVVPDRKCIRIVRGDSAHLGAHGEGDLDHLIECRLIARRTEGALVGLLVYTSQGSGGVEYAAAARTQDVPRQLENSNAGCVQERGDDALFVKAPFSRKIQNVDPAKLAIGAVADQRFHGGNHLRISGLPHYAEQTLGSSFAQ